MRRIAPLPIIFNILKPLNVEVAEIEVDVVVTVKKCVVLTSY
jgi:hypothetical protein